MYAFRRQTCLTIPQKDENAEKKKTLTNFVKRDTMVYKQY